MEWRFTSAMMGWAAFCPLALESAGPSHGCPEAATPRGSYSLRGFLQLCEFLGLAVEEFFAAVAGFFLADDAFAGSKPDGAAEFDFAIVAGG